MNDATLTKADSHHESFFDECKDFGQSFIHSAIENPVNGLIQVVDHAANVHIPELKLVGAPEHQSMGTMAGAMLGTVADVVAVTVATGGVAGALEIGANAAGIMAVTGAVYGGLLTPTDSNSTHFFRDRFANGGMDAALFGTMAGTAGLLTKSGMFAAAGERSLWSNVAFNAISGAAGGAAMGETKSILKDGKVLPNPAEIVGDTVVMGLYGGLIGAVANAVPEPKALPGVPGVREMKVDYKFPLIVPILDEKHQSENDH